MHGINRKAFAPLTVQYKVCMVLATWLVSVGFLYILNKDQNLHPPIDPVSTLQYDSPEKNHLGRCRFGLSNPADKHPLGIVVSFESLKTFSANTGPFKTAALREMDIRQLKIDLSDSPLQPASNTTDGSAGRPSSSGQQEWLQTLLQKLYPQPLDNQDFLRVKLPDMSHLVRIRISDFQCRFLDGQHVALHIESKKASVQADKTDGVLLRGHVIIRTPAATLESNSLLWDIQNQTFRVQGFYCIRTENGLDKGYDGFFDPTLNKITQQKTFANKGEVE